jgi:hypothetical protein
LVGHFEECSSGVIVNCEFIFWGTSIKVGKLVSCTRRPAGLILI